MRNDEMTEFDLKVRSLLEDAEEPVPSRLWSCVSSRLDRAAAPVVSPVWKWAGVVLAAAAVVAGAVLLVGNEDRMDAIMENNSVAQVVNLPKENIVLETPVVEKAAPIMEEPALETKESAPAAKEQVQETREQVLETEKAAPEAKKPATAGETWTDPFAEHQTPAKKSVRPSSIFAQGTLGGNDNGGAKILQSRYGVQKNASSPGIQEKSVSTFDIPVTFGLGVKFGLTERLSLGTGLEWSLLSRSFDGIYTKVLPDGSDVQTANGLITHNLQYIGVPVNVYFDIIQGKATSFYVWGGGEAQKCISNTYRISVSDETYSKSVSGLQFSVGAGFGVEFAIADRMGAYIDPSVRYWFGDGQPKSIRTEKPLTIGFEAGLRFNLQ